MSTLGKFWDAVNKKLIIRFCNIVAWPPRIVLPVLVATMALICACFALPNSQITANYDDPVIPTLNLQDAKLFHDYIAIDSNRVKYTHYLDSIESAPGIEKIIINGSVYYIFQDDLVMGKNDFETNIIYELFCFHPINDEGVIDTVAKAKLYGAENADSSSQGSRATVDLSEGRPITWHTPKYAQALSLYDQLTFAIDKNSFATEAQYKIVRDSFLKAANEWHNLCSIRFKYDSSKDTIKNLNADKYHLTFVVKFENQPRSSFIAYSFLPSQWFNPDLRYVHVYPAYFTTSYDRVGTFRHEIGHILGFRHEHLISPRGMCRNAFSQGGEKLLIGTYKSLTGYDSLSVMHYVCSSGGSYKLAISKKDRISVVELYPKSK